MSATFCFYIFICIAKSTIVQIVKKWFIDWLLSLYQFVKVKHVPTLDDQQMVYRTCQGQTKPTRRTNSSTSSVSDLVLIWASQRRSSVKSVTMSPNGMSLNCRNVSVSHLPPLIRQMMQSALNMMDFNSPFIGRIIFYHPNKIIIPVDIKGLMTHLLTWYPTIYSH